MKEFLIVSVITFSVLGFYLWFILKGKGGLSYFKTKKGKGALSGIMAAVGAFLLVGLLALLVSCRAESKDMEWFNSAEVYLGLDYTKDTSLHCEPGGVDDRGTSNLGANLNVFKYDTVDVEFKYTHHSCALGADRDIYDSVGVSVIWEIWNKGD